MNDGNIIEYKLNYDNFGNKRRYKLNKKRRANIIETNSWTENNLKNQWIYKDYNCYYIVISMFKPALYKVSCSGYTLKRNYKTLELAKIASFRFCDKLYK